MKFQFLIKSLPATLAALFFAFTLHAQKDPGTSRTAKPLSQDVIEASDDVKYSEYSRGLNLTADQKAAFKKADQEYKTKAKAAKNAKKEEMQRLRGERIRAHKATLSPEQLKKYDEMLAQKDAKRKEKQAQKQQQKAAKKAEKKSKKQ